MARKAYSPEQIIRKLRETEVYIGEGMTAREAARQIDVTDLPSFFVPPSELVTQPLL